jgi:beta-fructofuranosidase
LAIPPVRFAGDFNRPKYHLLPAANWTNETHSLFHHDGRYHIFNQKNASNMFLGQINWGHYSSPDLVNWTEHKPALTPEPGYDPNGIWSGHAVIDNGVPTLIYTVGGPHMGVGVATPSDKSLVEWRKDAGNPVILRQPDGFHRTDMRDQYVWKEGDTWYMIIGFGVAEEDVEKGAVLLYKSKDLREWEFLHTMFTGDPAVDDSGIFWEMPVFWKSGDKYILLVNKVPHRGVPAVALYWSGEFRDEKFVPDHPVPRKLEVVNRLLSPSVNYDRDGNVVAIAIIPDEIGSAAAYEHGWTHLYSIPRVWTIKDGVIWQTPHPALQRLRSGYGQIPATVVDKHSPLNISSDDHQLEATVTINPRGSQRFGFYLHRAPDNSEYTKIYYDDRRGEIVVDQRHSSLKKNIPLRVRTGSYRLDLSREVEFRVFIDRSVVEVFINGRDAFTTRIFPSKESSALMDVFTADSPVEVRAEIWKMNAADIKSLF